MQKSQQRMTILTRLKKLRWAWQIAQRAKEADEHVLPVLQTNIVKLAKLLEALSEIISDEQAREGKDIKEAIAAGIGHMEEGRADITALRNELANLATFTLGIEYFFMGNSDLWGEIIPLVDMDTFEQGCRQVPLDQLVRLRAAITAAMENKAIDNA